MVIKGNGAVNTMEAVKINTKEKERTKVTYHKSVFSSVLTGITCGAAILALAILVFLVGFILIHGVKNLTLEQFAWTYNTENVTMLPAIINTVTMTVLSLLLAAPLGIFSAIYLVEYANKRGKLVGLIRITAETLSGIPSIVYGLFGMLFFTKTLKMGYSMMSGACTLAIMILPLIMRTTEEADRKSTRLNCRTRHSFRCHSCDRPCRRRDGSASFHSRNDCKGGRPYGFRPYPCRSYVCTFQ